MGLDPRMRTMSMVQPSSDSWIQPGAGGYAPSIHAQGTGPGPHMLRKFPPHGQRSGFRIRLPVHPCPHVNHVPAPSADGIRTRMKALQGKEALAAAAEDGDRSARWRMTMTTTRGWGGHEGQAVRKGAHVAV
ncbi:conserved hypothetical protein [Verticillium alfalfae VaMs.102]|uniref:Uncharacterized protein n=1 Tax=Verticillium alfalfae (strain VaMs.102 / ATCC MYA-4576 / FGSC 10136) TaxID=526221 RepID=C9SK11_VERA1|nr:conserved hypothetical protein [Verticillium alfalfae VaMs.102]EEY19029.1 conserved hypothetical protein [Verticillium alfalfae VaMs.102]